MSEDKQGQLYQKIKEITDHYDLRISPSGEVETVLDEAKADFPTSDKMFPDLKDALTDDQIADIAIAHYRWFEKWFGSSK